MSKKKKNPELCAEQKGSRHLEEESKTNPQVDNLTGLAEKGPEIHLLCVLSL